ncbi:MAG: response regulator transcription factor [Planctomycetaceae bacterium]
MVKSSSKARVFWHRGTESPSVSEMLDAICPPRCNRNRFWNELEIAWKGSPGNACETRIQCDGVECDVRIFSATGVLIAACDELTPATNSSEVLQKLSPREASVLELLVSGLSNKRIAAKLNLSPRTVEKHRSKISAKTGCCNLAALTKLYFNIEEPV